MLLQNCMAAGLAIYTRKMAMQYRGASMQIQALIMSVMYLFGLSFLLLYHDQLRLADGLRYWPYFALSGFSFVASYGLTHWAYEYVDTAIGTLFGIMNIGSVVVVSTLVIHEGLTLRQYAGAAILLVAIWVMLSTHVSKRMHGRWLHAFLLSVAAAVCYGVAVTSEKYLLDRTGLSTYLVFGWGAEWLLACTLALFIGRRKLKLFQYRYFLQEGMVSGIFRTGAAFLFIIALVSSNNSSVVAVWSGLRVLLAALLGIVLLHERHYIKRKVEASLLALLAVGFLLW